MKAFVKCEMCNAEISSEKCIFARAVVKNGKEHYFCCENHAEKYKENPTK